jgi:predicted nucleic acid-binding protein
MSAKVLDSFALIAYFRDESGAEAVEQLLISASRKDIPLHMTDVNYAEVKYSIVKKDGAAAWAEAAKVWRACPLTFIPQPARWPTLPPISKHVSS